VANKIKSETRLQRLSEFACVLYDVLKRRSY